jgi:hypothetical protein
VAFTTYDKLVQSVLGWLNREGDDEIEARVPDWIALAEARIRRQQEWFRQIYSLANAGVSLPITAYPMQLPKYVREVTAIWNTNQLSHGEIEILTPSAWRGFVQINSALGTLPRKAVIVPQMDRYMQDTAAGVAQGPFLYLWPQPPTDGSLSVDFEYIRDLDPITTSAVNGLFLRHPDLYLYGTLAESAPYLQHDERTTIWDGRFEQAVKEINIERERAQFSASRKRPTLPRKF